MDPKDKVADYKALRELMQQGLIAIRSGRPSDALAPLQAAARRGVDSYESHYYLARAYTALARWREASAEYERAIAKLPGDVAAWRGLGESRVELHDGPGAIRAFEKLVALAPGDAVAQDAARREPTATSRVIDEAARVIREALAIDPKPAQYWNSLGTRPRRGRADGRRREARSPRPRPASPPTACTPTTAASRSSGSAAATRRSHR